MQQPPLLPPFFSLVFLLRWAAMFPPRRYLPEHFTRFQVI